MDNNKLSHYTLLHTQALKMKIVLHYSLVILYHYLLFFYFPQVNQVNKNRKSSMY